jgi:hypothetical protein
MSKITPDSILVSTARVSMLRQWINEDRIINNSKKDLISNNDILFWLTGDNKYLTNNETHLLRQ